MSTFKKRSKVSLLLLVRTAPMNGYERHLNKDRIECVAPNFQHTEVRSVLMKQKEYFAVKPVETLLKHSKFPYIFKNFT